MAAFDTVRPHAVAGSAGRIGSIFVAAFSMFASWNDARLTRKALAALTDRELDDIGLSRADISDITFR